MKSHGVYGYHDILAQSYEEESDLLELRITGTIPSTDIVDGDFIEISDPIKFRGISLINIDKAGKLIPNKNYEISNNEDIQKFKNGIRGTLLKRQLNDNLFEELISSKILLQARKGLENSDISEQEIAEGKEEFLIFVFILNVNGTMGDMFEFFNKNVLSTLLMENNVRTIEFCRSGGTGNVMSRAHYIFHIVGYLHELKDIAIEKIHRLCEENNIECGTRLVFTAESLSSRRIYVIERNISS